MGSRSVIVGAVCGIALGVGVIAAVEAGTETAGAQGGFTVSPAQLKINQSISSAAVRRGNRALNYLTPIRTAATDNADTGRNGVRPLTQVPGSGQGWTSGQIGDAAVTRAKVAAEAIDSEKIAPGGVTSGDLADDSVTNQKIGAGAVGAGELGSGAVTTEKVADGAVGTAKLDADAARGLSYFGWVTGAGELKGTRGLTGVTKPAATSGIYQVATAFPVATENCAVQVSVYDETAIGFYGKYAIAGPNRIDVRIYRGDSDGLTNEAFAITVNCA